MARTGMTALASLTGWTGRRGLRIGSYPLDLGIFITYSLLAWVRHGHFHNRATRRAAAGHILATGINALPATLIVALVVGFIFSLPLLPLAATLEETELATLLLRMIGIELGPLLTAVVVIGRAGSAMVTELANMQLHGETRALERLGIDVRDFFVAPRLLAGSVAQLVLATYFTVTALFGGMFLASLLVGGPALELAKAVAGAVTPAQLLAFIGKNLLFGLLIAAAACYSALQTGGGPVAVPFRVQRAITSSLVLVFVIAGLTAAIWV